MKAKYKALLFSCISSICITYAWYLFELHFGTPYGSVLSFVKNTNQTILFLIYFSGIGILAFLLFYYSVFHMKEMNSIILIHAGLFSMIMLIGASFWQYASLEMLIIRWPAVVFIFVSMTNFFYALIYSLFNLLSKTKECRLFDNAVFKVKPLWIWLMMYLCWIPYLICCFPGNITWDSINQICQIYGIAEINGNNPPFQVLILYCCLYIGWIFHSNTFGILIYSLMQSLLLSFTFLYGLRLLYRFKVAKAYLLGLYLFLLLNPVLPVYAFTVGKDTLFAIFVLLFSLNLLEWMTEKDNKRKKMLKIRYAVLSVFLILLRNAGFYLVIIMSGIMLFKDRKLHIRENAMVLSFIMIFFILYKILLPVIGIPNAEAKEELSIPFQQTARYVNKHQAEITEEEKAIINSVLDYEALTTSYNPELSDPVKDTYRKDASKDELERYFKLWLTHFKRDPNVYISAVLNNCYGYFYPFDKGTQKMYVALGYPSNIERLNDFEIYDNPRIEILNSFMTKLQRIPLVSSLTRIGTYSCLLILSVAYFIWQSKSSYIIISLPIIFVLLGCCASPVNAYFRYAFPVVICTPFIFGLCVKKEKILD